DKVSRVPKYERFTFTPPPHVLSVKIAPLAIKLTAHTLPLRRPTNHKPRNLRSSQHTLTGLQPVFPVVSTYYFVGLQLRPPPFFRWRMRYLRASCYRCCYCSSLLLVRPKSYTRGLRSLHRSCRHRLRTSRHQKRVLQLRMDTKVILKHYTIRIGIERLPPQTHLVQLLIKRRHLTNQTRVCSAASILQPLTKTLHNIDLHYPILSIQTGGIEITAQYANPATKPITSAAATTAKILARYLSVLMTISIS